MGAIIFFLMGYVLYHSAHAASSTDSLSVEQIAEELSPSEFIEGDIKLPPGFDRAAMSFSKYPSKRWPSKTVPYIIQYNQYLSETFPKSRIRFVDLLPRLDTDTDLIRETSSAIVEKFGRDFVLGHDLTSEVTRYPSNVAFTVIRGTVSDDHSGVSGVPRSSARKRRMHLRADYLNPTCTSEFVERFIGDGFLEIHALDPQRHDSLSVEQIAEELSPSEFIEGDIKLPPGFDRAAMSFSKYPSKRWPSKTVPYIISSSFCMEGNFRKRSYSDVNSFGSPYDYSSVMHYSKYSFSKGSSPTITPKDPSKVIGQRSYFSTQDINQIRRLYNC
ncbi:unnamed protein product [Cyprideis torosa]|uniref:Metalloendopeptidase n=1 Tax=Cyprideis torosa TaxID=163714 RepID=A0A7R8ZPD3_9CRUS|nr:unnamed protein product [Cyprideis torosa]CAG0893711.1 unnamed protein product [Cyprideis torosa]